MNDEQRLTPKQFQAIERRLKEKTYSEFPEYAYDAMHNDIRVLLCHARALEIELAIWKAQASRAADWTGD